MGALHLPSGAYEVTIKIESENGSVSEQSQFYSKTQLIPPSGFPQYHIQAGYLQDPSQLNTVSLPYNSP